jgi:uncharacterized protein DUF1996
VKRLAGLLLTAVVVVSSAFASTVAVSNSAGISMFSGVFDTTCFYSHTLRDDPLLHPGASGASHVHDFFGNRTTDARSSGNTLIEAAGRDPAKTSCKDKLDRSAYWAPALYEGGRKLRPDNVHVYYRHHGDVPARPFPPGFGMVTHRHFWWCGPGTVRFEDGTVPACPKGRLFVILTFPACWDGVRLFASDGSHVSHGRRKCDAGHTVHLPRLTMFLSYRVDGKPHSYRLASGAPRTAHADFLNAWEPARLVHLVATCLNMGPMSCERKRR